MAAVGPRRQLPGALRPAFVGARVGALMSTRLGGVSTGRYASLNLGTAVGDDPDAVLRNRARFESALGGSPRFLTQVHGVRVLRLRANASGADEPRAGEEEADASVCTEPGIACVVQVADCLPVLFAAPQGRGVAAAHAGWRGLSAGVLEASVDALCGACRCEPGEIEAWLGPCIGPRRFEVGPEVREAFASAEVGDLPRFTPLGGGKWLADLAGLARDRLAAQGIRALHGGRWCTAEDASRFFSHRRDRALHGASGRMAAAIWIERA